MGVKTKSCQPNIICPAMALILALLKTKITLSKFTELACTVVQKIRTWYKI